ncbi:hypothetical protein ACFSQ3_08815 [Sphingobacterium corticis]|uniref:Uncharacterized protein n=1 Tax=Sphingobacterium corticis TaxID=1812823 RepID=A0ABW5NK98_9SPHI
MEETIVDDLLGLEYMFDNVAIHRKELQQSAKESTIPIKDRMRFAELKLMRLLVEAGDENTCKTILNQVRQALQYCSQRILSNPILATGTSLNIEKSHKHGQELLQFQAYIEDRYGHLLESSDIVAPLIVVNRIRLYRAQLREIAQNIDSAAAYTAWKSLLAYFSFDGKQLFKIRYYQIWERDAFLERLSVINAIPISLKYFSRIDASLILLDYAESPYRATMLNQLNALSKHNTFSEQLVWLVDDLSQMDIVSNATLIESRDEGSNVFLRSVKQLFKRTKKTSFGLATKNELSNQTSSTDKIGEKKQNPPYKILCNLSADQLALILRSVDDTRLLTAKSLSMVFSSVVPYLSTPARKNLSANSLRSKSYDPEESDREKVITVLQKMIASIKGY